jgi:hypothetical protein
MLEANPPPQCFNHSTLARKSHGKPLCRVAVGQAIVNFALGKYPFVELTMTVYWQVPEIFNLNYIRANCCYLGIALLKEFKVVGHLSGSSHCC